MEPGRHGRAARGSGGDAGRRMREHRSRHGSRGAEERAPLERCCFPNGSIARGASGPIHPSRAARMKPSYGELKEQAWQANMEIPRRGLAIYTFGNVSAFDPERAVFAIKPSGVAYDNLTEADMV